MHNANHNLSNVGILMMGIAALIAACTYCYNSINSSERQIQNAVTEHMIKSMDTHK
jgi:hypothetical protein